MKIRESILRTEHPALSETPPSEGVGETLQEIETAQLCSLDADVIAWMLATSHIAMYREAALDMVARLQITERTASEVVRLVVGDGGM